MTGTLLQGLASAETEYARAVALGYFFQLSTSLLAWIQFKRANLAVQRGSMLNVISVDVEDYFHATNLDTIVGPARWHSLPRRVEYGTEKLLELFARHNAKGTFFVLGHSARRVPQLVRKIAERGHEVASHGYGHRVAYLQSERAYFRDVNRTKRLLEDITGAPIIGYRAPNFSIRDSNAWAYDALIRAGYRYDSSLYPVWHPRYENADKPTSHFVLNRPAGSLLIVPLATCEVQALGHSWRLPVAGGAYWRLLPERYCRWGLRRIAANKRQFVCYIHPWEVDTEQEKFKGLGPLTHLRHYGGIQGFERRIGSFLDEFTFTTIREAYAEPLSSVLLPST